MASRKRKSPKAKRGRQQPGLALMAAGAIGGLGMRGLGGLASLAGRYPSTAGGTLAFVVIFSFVAANALWYQQGAHPHPFLRTRDPASPRIFGSAVTSQNEAGQVTTFRIERQTADADAARTTNAVPTQPATAASPPSPLVMDIQKELIRRGLYNGTADGVTGPRTSAAILFFQQTVGMAEDGEATPEVLAALKTDSIGASTLPAPRPAEKIQPSSTAPDPVAAAILDAERQMKPSSVTHKVSATPPPPAARPAVAVSSDKKLSATISNVDLVLKIQKGLANMAYANVGVDGVVGDTTREAIKHFQKHYNLPPTGEPSEAVLKKLKEIGAL
ncbi:peptidoglycan-binding domain-containing protein [Oryzifoliimicrobium ureilyticus]|uniref:peptidoglycan-binding domain-containing protein n=1 Tax=Oryzifoliimicrobium ureilyticus TaxID=3113724 RepID=UPI0030760888